MACQWRIRHKLMLGLALVVGLVGVLLLGALKGLASYRATVNMFDSKLIELDAIRKLKAELLLIPSLQPGLVIESQVKPRVAAAREALEKYQQTLQETIQKGRDPENGFHEYQLVEGMQQKFNKLDRALEELDEDQINDAIGGKLGLVESTDLLYGRIYDELFKRMSQSKTDFKSSFAIVLSISIFGILLMTGLLRFFYRWTFYPLRDLQAGVGRVGKGDFEHPIEIHSGDEMEELAGAFNDMTRRLRDIYSDLARQVNERSRQLVRSERLASVGFLAAGVAHEINNPLASIAFCSEALQGRLADILEGRSSQAELPAQQEIVAKYLKMIQDEAFRCKNITQRLLEFSRGGERSREPANLVEIIQAVLDLVQHGPWSKRKKILFAGAAEGIPQRDGSTVGLLAGGKLVASVNAEEIKSVVLNLVINALDNMDEGGSLTITLRQRDGMAEMVFVDTGCGMTAEVLENIFEPFFTRSRTGKGTGLGLSISYRIINQHGGEIEATSAGPNQGSTFTVRIPLQPTEPAGEEPAARNAA